MQKQMRALNNNNKVVFNLAKNDSSRLDLNNIKNIKKASYDLD